MFHDETTLQQSSHRYLALTGCWFETTNSDYLDFNDALERLKRKHLPHNPDEPVVLHREDIINRRGSFWRLRDTERAKQFDAGLLELVTAARFTLVIIVVDKLKLKQSYTELLHPYHMALIFMLKRYCDHLNHLGRRGDVMAESRGGKEDMLLKDAYRHIHAHGDRVRDAAFYRQALSSRKLKVKPKKANIAGLQLSDILANPCKRQILFDLGIEVAPPEWAGSFGERIAGAAEPKYNRHLRQGHTEGYGHVLFPK